MSPEINQNTLEIYQQAPPTARLPALAAGGAREAGQRRSGSRRGRAAAAAGRQRRREGRRGRGGRPGGPTGRAGRRSGRAGAGARPGPCSSLASREPDARGHCLDQGRSVLARAALWQRRAQAHPLDADTCVSLADLLTPLHAGNAAAPAAVRLVGRQDPTRRAQVLGLTLPYPAAGPGPAVHADAAQPGRGGRGRRGGLPGGGAGRAGRRHGAPQHGAPGPAAVGHAPGAPQCGA